MAVPANIPKLGSEAKAAAALANATSQAAAPTVSEELPGFVYLLTDIQHRDDLLRQVNTLQVNRSGEEHHLIVCGENGLQETSEILGELNLRDEPIRVTIVSPFFKKIGLDHSRGRIKGMGMFSFSMRRPSRKGIQNLARLIDILLVVPTLFCWLPAHLILSLLLRSESKGPALYSSPRIGFGEGEFVMHKYRSMDIESDDSIHRDFLENLYANQQLSALEGGEAKVLKLEYDPRITRIGKIIRKLSIDEIPQLWNVLRGEMSLIGPRPCLGYELSAMDSFQRNRFKTVPGVSGLWQVYGRSQCSIEQSHLLDNLYVYSADLPTYFSLLIKTPLSILRSRGAH